MTEKYDWRKLECSGDSLQSLYDEAVTEGMIDPKEVTFTRFKSKLAESTTIFVDKNIFEERKTSALNVANFMKNRQR